MKVILIAHTPTPEQTIASAAKLCYSASNIEDLRESVTPEKAAAFVQMLADFGHESPIEHVYVNSIKQELSENFYGKK